MVVPRPKLCRILFRSGSTYGSDGKSKLWGVNIPDERVPYILTAVEHNAAYMKATVRDERAYLEIADSLTRKGHCKGSAQFHHRGFGVPL